MDERLIGQVPRSRVIPTQNSEISHAIVTIERAARLARMLSSSL
jgi:hypothetical protein